MNMLPHRLKIGKVVRENEQVKTFVFQGSMIAVCDGLAARA